MACSKHQYQTRRKTNKSQRTGKHDIAPALVQSHQHPLRVTAPVHPLAHQIGDQNVTSPAHHRVPHPDHQIDHLSVGIVVVLPYRERKRGRRIDGVRRGRSMYQRGHRRMRMRLKVNWRVGIGVERRLSRLIEFLVNERSFRGLRSPWRSGKDGVLVGHGYGLYHRIR